MPSAPDLQPLIALAAALVHVKACILREDPYRTVLEEALGEIDGMPTFDRDDFFVREGAVWELVERLVGDLVRPDMTWTSGLYRTTRGLWKASIWLMPDPGAERIECTAQHHGRMRALHACVVDCLIAWAQIRTFDAHERAVQAQERRQAEDERQVFEERLRLATEGVERYEARQRERARQDAEWAEAAPAVSQAVPGARRGRPPATGRYETREELLDAVWTAYDLSPERPAAIARQCGVSAAVVRKIVDTREGRPDRTGLTRTIVPVPGSPSGRLVGIMRERGPG